MTMRTVATLLLILLLAPAFASAQEFEYRWEAFGSATRSKLFDDEGSLGAGTFLQVGVGWRPLPKGSFEFGFSTMDYRRDFLNPAPPSLDPLGGLLSRRSFGRVDYFTADALYHFSRSRVQPYIIVGSGLARIDARLLFREYPDPGDPIAFVDTVNRVQGNGWILKLGLGMKIFVNVHWSLRLEAALQSVDARPHDKFLAVGAEPGFTLPRLNLAASYHW